MVVQRRRSSASTASSYEIRRPDQSVPFFSDSEVKMGDGRHSPTDWMVQVSSESPYSATCSPDKLHVAQGNFPSSTRRRSTSSFEPYSWWIKVFTVVSLVVTLYTGKQMNESSLIVRKMEREMLELRQSLEKNEIELSESTNSLSKVKQARSEVQDLNERLQHEAKMIAEMEEEGIDLHAPTGDKPLDTWLSERLVSLRQHWESLKNFVQDQSRQAVVERFGSGPHQVEMTVEISSKGDGLVSPQSFTVELASINEMPHSVFFFLDTVEKGLWNDTVFLYHDSNYHVMAAVPLDYETHSMKQSDLQRLELQTLSFPEYSADYPHRKYSLGFANLGPTFYINLEDNTQVNGPGGQEHHQLPGDADPCFAQVIEGVDVIDGIVKAASPQSLSSSSSQGEQSISRIVSMRILAAQ